MKITTNQCSIIGAQRILGERRGEGVVTTECPIPSPHLQMAPPANYASPTSGEAYRDRRLTTNFELLSWNFLCADMFPYEDS